MTNTSNVEAYLRVAAISVAAYDALWTLSAEFSLYREQRSFMRVTRACLLFILIRYTSVLVIFFSNFGFFFHGFSESACLKFYLISPSFKVIQTTVSQLIVAIRTVAVSRQARWVVWTVYLMLGVAIALETISNIWRRVPFREPRNSTFANCTSGNDHQLKIAWVHYLAAMLYDAICLSIATGYIYLQSREQRGHSLDVLSKMLLKEGVLYFIFLTTANTLNLCIYLTDSQQAQSSGATLGYATTWIMSQRLLIHLQQYRRSKEHPMSESHRPPTNCLSNLVVTPTRGSNNSQNIELDVPATIEESVKLDFDQEMEQGNLHRHGFTTAHINAGYMLQEDPRRRYEVQEREESQPESEQTEKMGWEMTSAGKIFS